MKRVHSSQGFTIIELMIATVIFSMILLVVTAAIVAMGRLYYKGYVAAQTQEATRGIMEDLSNSIKYSGKGRFTELTQDTGDSRRSYFCIGTQRYSYVKDRKLVESSTPDYNVETTHGFVLDNSTDCMGAADLLNTASINNSVELLGRNMRIADLSIESDDSNETFTIRLRILYGDKDLMTGSGFSQTCKGQTGSQFCGVSELSTTVQKRVN